MANLFVSYSNKDYTSFVRKLVRDLRECAYSVVLDRSHFAGGHKLTPTILAHIERADYFLAILSANALESKWVRDVEIKFVGQLRKSNHRIRLLPILIGKPQKQAEVFPDHKYIDFRRSYQVAFAELIRTLPRADYDEFTNLRSELHMCIIQEKYRLLNLLTKAASKKNSWNGCSASDLMHQLGKVNDNPDVVDDAYWWLIVKGILQFLDIETWWTDKAKWRDSVDFAEISPRGIAFLNDLVMEHG